MEFKTPTADFQKLTEESKKLTEEIKKLTEESEKLTEEILGTDVTHGPHGDKSPRYSYEACMAGSAAGFVKIAAIFTSGRDG